MCDNYDYQAPRIPPARRNLFEGEDLDIDLGVMNMEDAPEVDDDLLAVFLANDSSGFQDYEYGEDDDDDDDDDDDGSESATGWTSSDSGSSIEVIDESVTSDEGICDDGVMHSPYQIPPPREPWDVNAAYYVPLSPMNECGANWSPQSWNSGNLYSPMSSPGGDCGPMYWSTPMSSAYNPYDSSYMTDPSFHTAYDDSFDDCY
ncbi:hypothetical protein GE061_015607 [Apolygus lucorum]|uniref:Uncharacterized protein n=1 Tax=Apolygus lucorum TaxID=248454 RepID=A0A8S9XMM0_APOLU|nr:hypothetical protein GE061_015607 [Apolygus lucorum]